MWLELLLISLSLFDILRLEIKKGEDTHGKAKISGIQKENYAVHYSLDCSWSSGCGVRRLAQTYFSYS
jgi:hypothetical protein